MASLKNRPNLEPWFIAGLLEPTSSAAMLLLPNEKFPTVVI